MLSQAPEFYEEFWDYILEAQPILCERYLAIHKISDLRLVTAEPVLTQRTLIAVPACFRLEYGIYESPESPHFKPANAYNDGHGYGHDIHTSGDNERVRACRETWARDVPSYPNLEYRFFYGKPPGGYPRDPLPDEVFLDCPDDYASLPLKTVAMARWALKQDYDLVLKADDDTLIYIPELVAEAAFGRWDYAGHQYMAYCQGGAGYWLSRRAMRALDAHGDHPDHWAEDVWVSRIMTKVGIKPTELHGHRVGGSHWYFGDHYDGSKLPRATVIVHAVQPHVMREWYAATHPRIALVMICTGEPYWQFLDQALAAAKEHMVADILLFTDSPKKYDVAKQVYLAQREWPYPCLMRYHTMLTEKEWLSDYDYVFHIDVDLKMVRPILPAEICADGLTFQEHSGYIGKAGTPEKDPRSAACVTQVRTYIHNCFFGGKTPDFLTLCDVLSRNIDIDIKNNFLPKWHDESHANWYVFHNPPAKILPGVYVSSLPNAHIRWVDKGIPNRPAEEGVQKMKDMPAIRGAR